MAAKKKKSSTKKKSIPRERTTAKKKTVKAVKEPEYMVQVSDPKMIRKDLLESLREVIIFMQGYEKFRSMQQEKVALFTALKTEVKELHALNEKLRKKLPKGKLQPVTAEQQQKKNVEEAVQEMPEEVPEEHHEEPVAAPPAPEPAAPPSGLAALESQLQDIEQQLQNIR